MVFDNIIHNNVGRKEKYLLNITNNENLDRNNLFLNTSLFSCYNCKSLISCENIDNNSEVYIDNKHTFYCYKCKLIIYTSCTQIINYDRAINYLNRAQYGDDINKIKPSSIIYVKHILMPIGCIKETSRESWKSAHIDKFGSGNLVFWKINLFGLDAEYPLILLDLNANTVNPHTDKSECDQNSLQVNEICYITSEPSNAQNNICATPLFSQDGKFYDNCEFYCLKCHSIKIFDPQSIKKKIIREFLSKLVNIGVDF